MISQDPLIDRCFLEESVKQHGLDVVIDQYETVLHGLQQNMTARLADPKPHYPLDWYEHWQQQITTTQEILTYLRQKKERV